MSEEGTPVETNEEKTKSPTQSNRLLQLPVTRVKTIMKTSPELLGVSQEGYFLITRATELFVEYMTRTAHKACQSEQLEYKSLSKIVKEDESLEFLEEIIPAKITMAEYWQKVGKENVVEIDDDNDENLPLKTPSKSPTKTPSKTPTTQTLKKISSPANLKSPNSVAEPIVID